MHERYLVFLAPWLLLLAVAGAFSARGWRRGALLGGLVLLHVAGFLAYHVPAREPVKSVLGGGVPYAKQGGATPTGSFPTSAGPECVVLVHARFLFMTWAFYDRPADPEADRLPPRRSPLTAMLSPRDLLDVVPRLRDARRAWLVISHEATPVKGHYRAAVLDALREAWGDVAVEVDHRFDAQKGIHVLLFARK